MVRSPHPIRLVANNEREERHRYWQALLVLVLVGAIASSARAAPPADAPPVADASSAGDALPVSRTAAGSLVKDYCIDCHDSATAASGLALDALSADRIEDHPEIWENVVRKLRARQMPPIDSERPDEQTYDQALRALETALDAAAARAPQPGRTASLRRLNRTEYENAIRDLLALDIDASALLPKDSASHGFDNVTVADLSPTLLNRYISAAQTISRLAVGSGIQNPGGETIRIPADVTQDVHVVGLPIGTRGGALIPYTFPQDGQYEIQVRLARDRNEHVEGLREAHELEVLLDRQRVDLFTVEPPRGNDHSSVDAELKTRIDVTAGPHKIGVTFLKQSSSLLETKRQPYQAHFNMHRHPRIGPAIYQISIVGPYAAEGAGDTPSRRRIFICRPKHPDQEEDCARRILSTLMRRAYRRPITDQDLETPMRFFHQARSTEGFEAGIEMALSSVLVNPQFLFRVERDPPGIPANTAYEISDLELASRLSFFLWSSIPDDELLEIAIARQLRDPGVLEAQTQRMLADPRSRSLVTNFAGQWLYLRNLESITPDLRLFPDFDDNLRQAFRQETELFFESIIRENRSVLDLLRADYTYLNERLAKHYEIPHVYGSRFRRVALDPASHRGGLLRHGSILTVTSYATRTSPVIRGNWVLANILGTPMPPPPDDVPALQDNTVSSMLSGRERLAEHRANPACASCHNLMDPIGFALENFDAVGRWRTRELDAAVDASGGLPDGSQFEGVAGLERGLLERPELFVGTLAEKLLTYAIGRGVDYRDAPAIRAVVRRAEAEGYRFESLITGIVTSPPFQMRSSE